MTRDWFRHETWTDEIQDQFFAKYKRARKGYNRGQYAGIQAIHLLETQEMRLAKVALELLELSEQEDQKHFQRFQDTRAKALDIVGDVSEALKAYRIAIQGEQRFGASVGFVQIPFGYFVLRRKLAQQYQEVLQEISEKAEEFLMPLQAYDYHLLSALLNKRLGHLSEAVIHAKLALDSLDIVESAFAKHRKLGLATQNDEFHSELVQLADSGAEKMYSLPSLWKHLSTLKRRSRGKND